MIAGILIDVSFAARCWSDVTLLMATSCLMLGFLTVSFAGMESKRATMVSPVRRSRSFVLNFVVSGIPSAVA